jgi:hypothetical protein
MSLTTKQNYQLKKPNSHRRYILESPIRNSNKQEEQIQFLNIPNINNSKSISQQFNNQQNLPRKTKHSSQSRFIINDKSKSKDQYQPIYLSQSKFNNFFSFFFKLIIFSK